MVPQLSTYRGGTQLFLTYRGILAILAPNTNFSNSFYWRSEKVNFQRGDVDLNGYLTVDDVTQILSYLDGETSFINIQKFLADVDYDGMITENDVIALQTILDNNQNN